ncbi:MAG: TetR/AcrR family transcriptional regulator [Mycobacterium sp.]
MATRNSAEERQPLGRALIASTAAEMIDEVGVDNLTMRAVAARLGVSAMALYHHVEDKDELVRMVGDDLLGRIELPDPDSGHWRDVFMSIATTSMDTLLSVPGLSSVLLTSKLLPNARRLVLFCIYQFERAGLDKDAAREAYAGVHQLVLGRLIVEESANFQLSSTPHPDDEIRDYMVKLRSRATFESAQSALLDHYLPSPRPRRSR